MSFLSTDTKSDVVRNYGTIAEGYGYKVSVIALHDTVDSRGQNESMVMDEPPNKKKEKTSSGGSNSLRTNESEQSGEPS